MSKQSIQLFGHQKLPDKSIMATRHLTPRSRIPLRIVRENGSAVLVSIHQPNLTALKINAKLPFKRLLPHIALIT
jgi:hypothetical protein